MAILVVLFIVVPIVEIFVIVKVGQLVGIWPTLALILASALIGSWLLRSQGRGAWHRFNEAIGQRRFPGKEVADGALIIVGGTLLLTPGFLTDIAGIALLVPPTRAGIRSLLRRYMTGRFAFVTVGSFPGGGTGQRQDQWSGPGTGGGSGSGPGAPPANRPYDVDGTAEEEPEGGGAPDRELPRTDED